ncbi:uncharacterized protein J4E88_010411 [Alternaria novae-zelandiae]|uniref:uncharacterized protein n=1 Tax=Alternaria novae-zelandiae TaxID=430562 RepID=UPI0020C33033|nr:uncharacterized protein J4E88_010411 [Alternaria novae-zelandiae]KAI4666843.1 hypothetical protein J4E88_010411 [Alternaria novae-zelandiae]
MDSKRRKTGDQDVSALRLASRQKYLAEREAQQLALLRRQVAEEAEEEQRLGNKLSERERAEFKKNRQTLELAEARNAIDDRTEGMFMIPDSDYSSKHEALTKRHKEKGYEKSEAELWEEQQTKAVNSQAKVLSKNDSIDNYDFVFDTSMEVTFKLDETTRVDVDKQMLQRQLDEAEKRAQSIEDVRRSLPVYKYRDELIAAVEQHQVIIVVSETGSGKSTQIPRYILDAGLAEDGMIAVTQPRRVAAMSVASRVAEEYGCKLGNEVGYSIRFEDKTGPKTKIKFATDGILLQEAKTDPLLQSYSCVMIDEAHERSLASDLLLVLCREVCRARPDFKLLILSATINAAHFSQYFNDSPIFQIPGQTWPVQVLYTSAPEANYLAASITTVMQIHISGEPGHILVFLTGEEEIQAAMESLEETKKKLGSRIKELVVRPMYSSLPQDQQNLAFAPVGPDVRKVLLCTNIAETSVTFEGVRHVIDPGYAKENTYDNTRGLASLTVTPISRNSANQRKGRAGRTSSGFCYRLYTRAAYYNELPEETTPEIQRSCLDSVVLTLKQLRITNLLEFEFLDSPSPAALIKSLEELYRISALDSTGALTRLGRRMAELPLDIKLSKAIIESEKYGCREEILAICAFVQEAQQQVWLRPKDKKVAADAARKRFTSLEGGDFLTYLNIWNQFVESGYDLAWARENFLQGRVLNRVRDVKDQLERLADRVEVPESSCGTDHVAIRKCLTAAFFTNAARLQRDGQTYRVLANSGLSVHIHPSSPLIDNRPKWCIFASLQATSKEWMMTCAPIEPEWLVEVAPHMHTESSIAKLGDNKKMPKATAKMLKER